MAVDRKTTDAGMMEAVKAGDTAAFRGLVEKYQERIYHVLYGMLRNPEDAAEATQDVFIKAWRSLHTFREDSSFFTWLYRIAMNLVIDRVRRRDHMPMPGPEQDVLERESTIGLLAAPDTQTPRRMLESKQTYKAIMDALDQLPLDQKQAVLLRELEGLSYKEIGAILDVPEGTVMSRLFYARKKLQAILSDFKPDS